MKGFTLIELAIVIVIAALLAAVAVPIYNGIVEDSKWSEGKTAAGTIKAAMDTYSAKTSGDLSQLTTGTVGGDFASGAPLLDQLKLDTDAFEVLQYFDATDFAIVIAGVVGAETYTITVTGNGGGLSGNGPTGAETGTYSSALAAAGSEPWGGRFL